VSEPSRDSPLQPLALASDGEVTAANGGPGTTTQRSASPAGAPLAPLANRPLRRSVGLLGAATLLGLFFASQAWSNPALRSEIDWRKALSINLTYYWLWGASVPLIVALAKRFPFRRGRWVRPLLVHLATSVALTAAIILLTELLLTLSGTRDSPLAYVLPWAFGVNFHSLLPTYWWVLAGWLALDASARARERELAASQLLARLADARLQALRQQLQPHFLFNTLNSISALMYSDVEAADAMMARLADLLRITLALGDEAEVPLWRELELAECYLDIERIRFEERLAVTIDVDDAARRVLVPVLVLQPLVENAVRHGIDRLSAGGRIAVTARRAGERLVLVVSNDGPPPRPGGDDAARRQLGLANTRERLAQLHGGRARLELAPLPAGGATVTVEVPWRTADEAEGADRRRRAAGTREALDATVPA
jgi:two-component system LytT family sensor kinase